MDSDALNEDKIRKKRLKDRIAPCKLCILASLSALYKLLDKKKLQIACSNSFAIEFFGRKRSAFSYSCESSSRKKKQENNGRTDTRITKKTSTGPLLCYKYRTVRHKTTGHPVRIIERTFPCGTASRRSYFAMEVRRSIDSQYDYFRFAFTSQESFLLAKYQFSPKRELCFFSKYNNTN